MKRYHWVVTISVTAPGVQTTATNYGTCRPQAGQTRSEVFKELYDQAVAEAQEDGRRRGFSLASPVCMFFSLEPDEL